VCKGRRDRLSRPQRRAGKSTLLKILAGLRKPDAGAVTITPKVAAIGYVAQETERREDEAVRAFLQRRTGVAEAEATMNAAAEALGEGLPGADDAYSAAL
jgi:ATPase subunit of ABC transporter with duplicated ATPase domains